MLMRRTVAQTGCSTRSSTLWDERLHRVRRLITSYGLNRRRVAVPIEWVAKRSAERLVLAVGVRSLDDLQDWASA